MLIELQRLNELRFNKELIDGRVREWIANEPNIQAGIEDGIEKLREFLSKDYYQAKDLRLAPVKSMNLTELVNEIMIGVAFIKGDELFTSVVSKLAGRLGFDDKPAAITTMGEFLAVLCQTDMFDIFKFDPMGSLYMHHNLDIPEELAEFIANCEYLPPMLCKPIELTHNRCSGYLTHESSLVLGNGNHHNGDLCLDVLNIVNGVQCSLDTEFLSKVEEEPKNKPEDAQQLKNWNDFKKQSHMFYKLMVSQGNKFYFTNKWDKRGRMYAQGYHINCQGAAYKKAMLNLTNEEIIDGVPTEFAL